MKTISGFPCYEVEFTRKGAVHAPAQAEELLAAVRSGAISDLFVISHGWNNDMAEARDLYAHLLAKIASVMESGRFPALAERRSAVLAVFWPSKKFADKDLIASGAASLAGELKAAALEEELDAAKAVFTGAKAGAKLEEARALLPRLERDPAARERLVELVRGLASPARADREDGSDSFFTRDPAELMDRWSKRTPALLQRPKAGSSGGAARIGGPPGAAPASAAGDAAGLGRFFEGVFSAARNVLNYTTYYEMKERAGRVGRRGLNGLLREVRSAKSDIELHLIGHSFGGRLVTAAADGSKDRPALRVSTLTLLQAAFSHNGFAERFHDGRDGAFRKVVVEQKVRGPILVTHTQNDQAVGFMYPLASLLSGQDAAALGDANDRFGGIGRNGARKTPEAQDGKLLAADATYRFRTDKKIYNLNSDAFIGGHSDVCKNEVANAILAAVATT
jgi:hypothetical protein